MANTFSVIASDNFTRANENPLSDGGNWTAFSGNSGALEISSDVVVSTAENTVAKYAYTGASFPSDQYSQVTLQTLQNNGAAWDGVMVRATASTGNCYQAYLTGALGGSCTLVLLLISGGVGTSLGTYVGTFNQYDVLSIYAQDTNIVALQNGSPVITATDSTLSSGYPAIGIYSGDVNNTSTALGGTNQYITGWQGGGIFTGTISSVSLNPMSVSYPTTSTGTVTLSGNAPTGGVTIALLSSAPEIATVPVTVTISGGSDSATFTVTSLNVSGTATIYALIPGNSASAVLTVSGSGSKTWEFLGETHSFLFPTSDTQQLTISANQGDLLIGWVTGQYMNPAEYTVIFQDNVNTWIPIDIMGEAGYGGVSAFYTIMRFTGTITVNIYACSLANQVAGTGILQNVPENFSYPTCQILRFSGAYGNPLETYNLVTNTGTTLAGSLTVSGSADLIIGIPIGATGSGWSGQTTSSWFNPLGLNILGPQGNTALFGVATSSGTFTPDFLQSPSGAWGVLTLGFKAAAATSTHTISGSLGAGGAGATVNFLSQTTYNRYSCVANGSGDYTCTLADDSYWVSPALVGYTFSSIAKSVTLSGSNQTGINFTATAVNPYLIFTQTFSDTMQRANEDPLSDGGNWQGDGTPVPPQDYPCQLLSNECVMSNAAIVANYAGPFSGDGISFTTFNLANNQYAGFQIDSLTPAAGGAALIIRVASEDTENYSLMIHPELNGTASLSIAGIAAAVSPTPPALDPSGMGVAYQWYKNVPFNIGDTFIFAILGTLLVILHNGTIVGNYSDSSLTSGAVGITLGGTNINQVEVSHFVAGSVVQGVAPSPTRPWLAVKLADSLRGIRN